MEQFLPGLLHDLDRSCKVLKERLDAGDLPLEVTPQANRAYALVESVHREVLDRLADTDLTEPSLLTGYLRLFRRWVEQIRIVEGSILPAIERYGSRDRLATRMCARLAQQIRWPIVPPVVATMSATYYWCFPPVNLVFIPTAEDASHLGLPDLCHEMAHILLESNPEELLGDFLPRLSAYIAHKRQQVDAGELPANWRPGFDLLDVSWKKGWYREFVPDIVATFAIGPAYGWQHVRLSSRNSADAYFPSFGQVSSHPANDARLRCITTTLRALGSNTDADELQAVWAGYVSATKSHPGSAYELAYPGELLQFLVDTVLAGCKKLDVRSFHRPRRRAKGDVVQLLRDIWKAFLANPANHFKRDRHRFKVPLGF